MTGPEHYQLAEELVAECTADDGSVGVGDGGEAILAAAQVHATLALAAALAMGLTYLPAPDWDAWRKAAATAGDAE